ETLLATGLTPEEIFPGSFYERLDASCHVVHPAAIADSPPSRRLLRGASVHGYEKPEEGVAVLARVLAGAVHGYGLLYLPEVDFVMHHVGPDDPDVPAL